MVPMTNFGCKLWIYFLNFRTLLFALPENGFNVVTQKFSKQNKKYYFQTLILLVFDLKVASNLFSKMVSMLNLSFN